MDKEKPLKEAKLSNGKVWIVCSLKTFISRYTNTNVGTLDHCNIIGTISDGKADCFCMILKCKKESLKQFLQINWSSWFKFENSLPWTSSTTSAFWIGDTRQQITLWQLQHSSTNSFRNSGSRANTRVSPSMTSSLAGGRLNKKRSKINAKH